jgi:hypothetical protein
MVSIVPVYLRIITAAVSLAVAVVAGVAAARDRAPGRATLNSLWLIVACCLALTGTAVAGLVSGHRAPSMVTLIGYLIAFLAIPVLGWVLARMEPSRWGSVIIAAAAVVTAILVVRLDQVWTGI